MSVVTFTYNPEPAPACYPADVNGLAQLLTQGGMLAGTVPDNAGGGIFVGSAPPSSSLTYKVWFKIDGSGRPLGAYMFYNGNWRKVYTGAIGDVKMYHGSGANFDGNGLGVVGSDVDGWAICNGNYGTANMTDARFPMGGSWDGSSWRAPGQGQRGGVNNHTLTVQDLPQLAVDVPYASGRWQSGSGGGYIDVPSFTSFDGKSGLIVRDANGTLTDGLTGQQLPIPLFQVFAFIQFVGYF